MSYIIQAKGIRIQNHKLMKEKSSKSQKLEIEKIELYGKIVYHYNETEDLCVCSMEYEWSFPSRYEEREISRS